MQLSYKDLNAVRRYIAEDLTLERKKLPKELSVYLKRFLIWLVRFCLFIPTQLI